MTDISAASRVDWALDEWARYMRGTGNALGYPTKIAMIGVSGASDFDDLCDAADTTIARAVDALIDDLGPSQRASVYHVHLAAVWRFREPVEELYERARTAVEAGLSRKGLLV